MLQSLVKSCYFCPAPLREFASRGDQSFSVPIHYKVSYHYSEGLHPKLIQEIYLEGKNPAEGLPLPEQKWADAN